MACQHLDAEHRASHTPGTEQTGCFVVSMPVNHVGAPGQVVRR